MKKLSILAGLALVLLTTINTVHAERVERFLVIHNNVVIEVPWVAVLAHLAHGDRLCTRGC